MAQMSFPAPIDLRLCLNSPLRIAPSAWLHHVPFAMFLISILRPNKFVELGTLNGVSYCAFCQAVRELQLHTRCYAIDTWEGDPHTGFYGDAILAELKQHHDPLYGEFSTLIRATFDTAAGYFDDGTIDLLHIDGYHTYEAVKHDFFTWLPKMSDRGVMLLHDIEVRKQDFGVWQLWLELKQQYASFELYHGYGLGLLAVGEVQPEPLQRLVESPESVLAPVREFFFQAGWRLDGAEPNNRERGIQELKPSATNNWKALESLFSTTVEENHSEMQLLPGKQPKATITASPNPVEVSDGSTVGETEIAYTFPEELNVEVHIGSPDGPLFARPAMSGASKTGRWVTSGMVFYLQDVTGAKPLIRKHTLATVAVRVISLQEPVYRTPHLLGTPAGLKVAIETAVPDTLIVGRGNALYVRGWCHHSCQTISQMSIAVGEVSHPVKSFRMARCYGLENEPASRGTTRSSECDGFWSIVPLPQIAERTTTHLSIQATLQNGETCLERVTPISLEPAYQRCQVNRRLYPRRDDEPLIAICMATYNPRVDLFAKQIQSITDQTHSNWICIISDDNSEPEIRQQMQRILSRDERFSIEVAPSRLGFYRNFERCMALVPEEAEFVALSDQDDYWHPDKLTVLRSQLEDNTTLVYSDMNIVDDKGNLKSKTFWTTRRNNYTDMASLIFGNTITGAASLFSRRLLTYILPFPRRIGEGYHDHWLACVALAMGSVKYVNRPLYDYVQHSGNLVGHYAPEDETAWRRLTAILKKPIDFLTYVTHAKTRIQRDLERSRRTYFDELLKAKLICTILDIRCGPYLSGAKQRTIRRIIGIDESFTAPMWLAIRCLRNMGRLSATLGAENRINGAIWWRKFWTLRSRLKASIDRRRSDGSIQQPITPESASSAAQWQAQTAAGEPVSLGQVDFIKGKIAPLILRISNKSPRRVNLLIPALDLKHFFGGYIAKLNFARGLAQVGFKVRIVAVDHCENLPSTWKQQIQAYQGLETLFDRVETTYAFDRTKPLEVGPEDLFVATTWWTAHIAHHATVDLGKEGFLYLIQEYEPLTFPMGTFAALAEESYTFPHYGIFSTEILRDYFRQNTIGVFAENRESGNSNSISFQNAITRVGTITAEEIVNRQPKRVLVYARPEDHAARNMFELALLALSEAIDSGAFRGEWEFNGIGTVGAPTKVSLSRGAFLQLLPRQSQDDYRLVLREHDLGLSLMYTPHPSLVPIEMASAGMLVVTNTYANKTADKLAAISSNIIGVKPTIEDVTVGLKTAAENIEDYDRRIRGSNVNWSTSWETSFDERVLGRIKEFCEALG